jgi:hypothetical protein
MSRGKRYNPQTVANNLLLTRLGKEEVIKIISTPIEQFFEKYAPFKARDFIYKSDYFTPRNMFLLNPLYYTYYTFMVFKLSYLHLDGTDSLDFSTDNQTVFYSGLLNVEPTKKQIKKNSSYSESYKTFQNEREYYFGKSALRLDIKDFFNSITVFELISKLRAIIGNLEIINDLECFFSYCGFDNLPQLHYSIASSILSQFYLFDFDAKMNNMLDRENLHMLRFVDDMYIIHLDGEGTKKKNNNILNEISYFLWEDSLVLNTSKTKMLTAEEFIAGFELANDYDFEIFSSEKIIEEKACEVITNGNLISLINKLCKMEKKIGIDLKKYKELMDSHLSIDGEDSNKILNHIIFSKKWRALNDSELLKLIANWKYILFNPSQFTILYIMVYRYLKKKNTISDNGLKIKGILNYLFRNETFTFRDTLVAVTYLFQSSLKNSELLKKVERANPGYVNYVETFIL